MIYLLLILLFNSLNAQTIEISNNYSKISLLEHASIFLDEGNMSINELLNNSDYFKPYSNKLLNIGGEKEKVWIKLSLHNRTDKKLKKIFLFTDPSLEHISLYNEQGKLTQQKGIAHYHKEHKTLFFYLPISLNSNETKTFYMQIYNDYVPLGFSLQLTDENHYIQEDRESQLINLFLMGMIASLALYSFVMGFYMREKSYFYYALYLGTLLYMTLGYLGFTSLFFSESYIAFDYRLSIVRVYIITIATALFAINFLKIKYHKPYYYTYLTLISLTILMMLFFNGTDKYSVKIALLMATITIIYNFFVGIIIYKKGYKEARFYIVGFGMVLVSYLIMISDALGWSYVTQDYYNLILWTTLFEALALSLAFADRYIAIQEKLIYEITHKQTEIEEEVTQKTQQINQMLNTKELLLKELHHRVKNNLYIILSMVQMQGRASSDTSRFKELENRIHAISKSYDTLMLNQNLDKIEMKSYLNSLIKQIALGFKKESIKVISIIDATLPLSHAVYVGLIVNELLTNAYKYAFDEQGGSIEILLQKEEEQYHLQVKDNGKGFEPTQKRHGSLGLILVESLVKEQLRGKMKFESLGGVLFEVWF